MRILANKRNFDNSVERAIICALAQHRKERYIMFNNNRDKWNDANDSFSREWRREMNPYPEQGDENPYQSGRGYRRTAEYFDSEYPDEVDIDDLDLDEDDETEGTGGRYAYTPSQQTYRPSQEVYRPKRRGCSCVVLILGFILMIAGIMGTFMTVTRAELEEANAAMENHEYVQAYELYRDAWLDDVPGAEKKMHRAAYNAGKELMLDEEYEDAAYYFALAADYENAEDLYNTCTYYAACRYFADGDFYSSAYTLLDICDFEDSEELLKQSIENIIRQAGNDIYNPASDAFNDAYFIAKYAKDYGHIVGWELYRKYFADCPEISIHLYANEDDEEHYGYFVEGDTVWVEITMDSAPAQGSTLVCYCYVNGEEEFESSYDGYVQKGQAVYVSYDDDKRSGPDECDEVEMYFYTQEGFYLGSTYFEIWTD